MKTNRNFGQTVFSALMGLALLAMTIQPATASAATSPVPAAFDGDVRTSRHPQTGMLTFLGADPVAPIRVAVAMREGLAPQERGLAILEQYGAEFGLQNPREELIALSTHETDGRGTVRYQQVYQNVSVMGGELIVNTDAQGALLSINGEVSPSLNLSTEPAVGASAAREQALKAIARVYGLDSGDLTATEPALWIYDARLLNGEDITPAHLVWRVEVSSAAAPIRELVLVNATTGEISLHFNQIDTAWRGEAVQQEGERVEEVDAPATAYAPKAESVFVGTPAQAEVVRPESGSSETALSGIKLFVSPTGNDLNDCLSKATPCATLQHAIDIASNGDVIRVATGIYSNPDNVINIVEIGKTNPANPGLISVTFSGGWNENFTVQDGYSIIDGANPINPSARKNGILVSHDPSNSPPSVTVDRFIIKNSNNGIELNSANLIITNSAITNGGVGIYATMESTSSYSSTATVKNVTIDRNGTAIFAWQESIININNSTIVKNRGPYTPTGGIYIANMAVVKLHNTILAQNDGALGPDCYVEFGSTINNFPILDHNIIGSTDHCAMPTINGNLYNVDPGRSVYFAGKGYYSFVGSSPILGSGNSSTCASNDQRGNPRFPNGDIHCDMGAVEREIPAGPAANLVILSGSNQQVSPNQTFPLTLDVAVVDADYDPVANVTVTFRSPNDGLGASGTFANGRYTAVVVSDAGGVARSPSFTANSHRGAYSVSASASGVSGVAFTLKNILWFVSSTGSDANSCKEPEFPCATINSAIQKAQVGATIYLAEGIYAKEVSDLYNSVVRIGKSVKIVGGWDPTFSTAGKPSIIDGGSIYSGIVSGANNVTIERVIVRNIGFEQGGIQNDSGTLILDKVSVIDGNGVGITNFGGDLVMRNSTVSHNRGGVDNADGNVLIENSTIVNNVYTHPTSYGGGVRNFDGTTTLRNSIVAGNSAREAPDCYHYEPGRGALVSGGNNIIGSTQGCAITPKAGDKFNVDPKLSPLLPLGYHPIKSPSPARNAGNPATCTSQDQRGVVRLTDSKCDIGAYEYKPSGAAVDIVAVHPEVRRAGINAAFHSPLAVAAIDSFGTPVGGITVNFAAPASGPSGTFQGTGENFESLKTDASGFATSSVFSANGETGDYNVVATAPSISKSATFQLHNGAWMVKANGGNDSYNCLSPSSACKSLEGVLKNREFNSGDVIWVASGSYPGTGSMPYLKDDATIVGGWNQSFTGPGGATVIRGFYNVYADITFNNVVFTGSAHLRNFGNLVLENSTFYRTELGILNDYYGNLTLSNVTMTGNGNQYPPIRNDGGRVLVANSTITGNRAYETAGIRNEVASHGVVILRDTILAGNIATMPTEDASEDCKGDFISLGHNIIGTIGMAPLSGTYDCRADWMESDLYGDDEDSIPVSRVLMPTAVQDPSTGQWYRPLKLGSLALDAGNEALPGSGGDACPATDQLGVSRPQGERCDIGAVEFRFVSNSDSLLTTYTAGNATSLPGTQVCSGDNGICTGGDTHAQSAHANAYSAYQWYQTWFGRNSIDGNGMQINSVVHYGSNYQNAFWNGYMLIYGDGYGFPFADDVVAHEYTHGVTQYESNLFYWYQSGAINESFSDLWGEAIDQVNGRGNDTADVKWLIGENVTGHGAFRNMADPPAFGQPDSMTSSKYCDIGTCLDDNGGVYINSGVNNKAVYLMVAGGTFNNKTVSALGWTKVLAIYYEAQTNLLTSGSDYLDLYNFLYQACLNKVGTKGITNADCQEVRDATDAVKMNLQPAVNFNPNVSYCPAGTYHVSPELFYEDFETGTDGWTMNAIFGALAWRLSGANARKGAASLWADDGYHKDDSYASTPDVNLPVGSKPYLHFSHSFGFEAANSAYYDGGVLEYSTNHGTTWVDAESFFSAGQNYRGAIQTGFGNRLQGRDAFVGDSHGYVDSRYELSPLAGKTIRFRWRMGTDSADSVYGWYVDDVRIYTCVGIPSVPSLLLPNNNALLTDYTPTFDWSDSTPDLHHYQMQLATDSAFTQNKVTYSNILTSTYTLTTLLNPATRYYWRVRAYNAVGKARAWSETRNFRTAFASPIGGAPNGITVASLQPTFTWDAIAGATAYRIQVSTSNTFATPLIDATIATRYYKPGTALPAATTLYWRVQVSGGAFAPGRWSVVWSFTTP